MIRLTQTCWKMLIGNFISYNDNIPERCEGIFCPWSTLTVTFSLRPTTDFGGRLGAPMVTTVLERMPTETLAFSGGQEVTLYQFSLHETVDLFRQLL